MDEHKYSGSGSDKYHEVDRAISEACGEPLDFSAQFERQEGEIIKAHRKLGAQVQKMRGMFREMAENN